MSVDAITALQEQLEKLEKNIEDGEIEEACAVERDIATKLEQYFAEPSNIKEKEFQALQQLLSVYEGLARKALDSQLATKKDLIDHQKNSKKINIYKQFR
jgi:hypothetical protein